jgi:hypothetical protein
VSDAQTGIARIFKPQLDFEAIYSGTTAMGAASEKIPFFEWRDRLPPNVRDPLAGRPGYDPNLLNYAAVPKGALLLFYFPFIFADVEVANPYRYFVSFRDSNLARYKELGHRSDASGYHIPFESPGQPDTTAPPGSQERFAIPAGLRAVGIQQPETPSPSVPFYGLGSRVNVRPEIIVPRGELLPPLLIGPGVRGVHQQGILDPAIYGEAAANGSGGLWFECVAQGDEILIAADRQWVEGGTVGPDWDFAGADSQFGDYYGSGGLANPHDPFPELGIYVYVTRSP